MKLYAQGLARALHEQRVQNAALAPGAEPDEESDEASSELDDVKPPSPPESLQEITGDYTRPSCSESSEVVTTRKPRVAHRVKLLNQSQQAAIELLVLGHTDRSVAESLGLHRVTICNWRLHHPGFRAELARRRHEVWSTAAEKFRARLERAVDVLDKQLADVNVDTSYRAARTILALARHFKPPEDPIDVEGVLTLEARRINVQKFEDHPAKSLVYEADRAEALEHLCDKAGEEFAEAKPSASGQADKPSQPSSWRDVA